MRAWLLQVESTARSWRAAGLLLMRQTVDQENRKAIVRGTICLIYLVRLEAWPLSSFAAEPCHCSHCRHPHDAKWDLPSFQARCGTQETG